MSAVRWIYRNQVDEGTVFLYSSQLNTLPATNIQQEILAKRWQTDSKFVVHSSNPEVAFRDTATTTVWNYTIPNGTYTGSGLASVVESGLNAGGGAGSGTVVVYDETTRQFQFSRSTGTLALLFAVTPYAGKSSAYLLGFEPFTNYSASLAYTSTATYGTEHELIVAFTSTQSVAITIFDDHEFTDNAIVSFRLARTATVFDGFYNQTADIIFTGTVDIASRIVHVDDTMGQAKAVQCRFADRDGTATILGRFWAGTYGVKQYANTTENWMSYNQRRWDNRTRVFVSEAGASWFDKRDKVQEWVLPIDPLDPYFNSATVALIANILERVETSQAFYIQFDATDTESTVYGYLTGDFQWRRLRKSPVEELRDLVFREQK